MQNGRGKRAVGNWGEQRAVEFVQTLGWQVVERNWRCTAGELDLVAREPDGTLVVVEVKARSGRGFGDPLEAITHAKVAKLHELTLIWLREHDEHPRRVRIDGIGVIRVGGQVELTHVRGVTG